MQMVYNSDSYAVVQFDVPPTEQTAGRRRGGFEIVDKRARKEIFIEGDLADRFQRGAQALVQDSPQGVDAEALDEYIAGFTALAQTPLALH
jgi:Protein of unknown function (DUF3567)